MILLIFIYNINITMVIVMGKALYVPDPYIRELVEEVKNELGLKSLRDTVERGMLMLKKEREQLPSVDERLAVLQARCEKFVGKNYRSMAWEEEKAFFDDLSGGI